MSLSWPLCFQTLCPWAVPKANTKQHSFKGGAIGHPSLPPCWGSGILVTPPLIDRDTLELSVAHLSTLADTM